MVIALRNQQPHKANELLAALVLAQNPDGSYPYALRDDPVSEIHTFPCVIAPAWNVLAWSGEGTSYPRILWI